ncbi:MAG: hypothetical protein SF029_19345 [bacterium]|nr:hypothetical protein [bacterium]
MDNGSPDYMEATMRTSADLYSVAASVYKEKTGELSSLTLPEVERLSQEIAAIVPAGNVPGLILNGLANLKGRTVEPGESRKYVELLFRGVRQQMDKAIYGAFFVAPAQILDGYQKLLRLAGKDPDEAFPEGTWQFYLEFALREDSARHANETTGFHHRLLLDRVALMDSELLGAWMLTAAEFARCLPDYLENEWHERMLLKTMADLAETNRVRRSEVYRGLYPQWEKQRPYSRAAGLDYISTRRQQFEAFWTPHYAALPSKVARQLDEVMTELRTGQLPAYQQQMSWLAYLEPGTHHERRVPYGLEDARLAVVYQARYYLLPLEVVSNLASASALAGSILSAKPSAPPAVLDELLVNVPRAEQGGLRRQLEPAVQQELDALRRAPVILNWDIRDTKAPLAAIRREKRGIGDHALTIFRTSESIVFDQSHIFFDGAWGAAVAEIMTNEALVYAKAYAEHTRVRRSAKQPPYSPVLQAPAKWQKQVEKIQLAPEASAENASIQLEPVIKLRQHLKQRSDQLQITVNDLFILYRGLHGVLYQPSPRLQEQLQKLSLARGAGGQKAHQAAVDALKNLEHKNPAVLIPIDASRYNPRDRVFPTTFRNPITDFWDYHQRTLAALTEYRASTGGNAKKAFNRFDETRGVYLRLIGGFGELLGKYKEIALRGESASTASIKFLAHMSGPMRKLLDNIPGRFDVLNEIIKGEEVFSNTGRVAPGSTLRRFITAKDDNAQKTFAWGVQTDDQNVVRLSLRDFRPHVKVLHEAGLQTLAALMVQDYLDAYAEGFNAYVTDLREIVVASWK